MDDKQRRPFLYASCFRYVNTSSILGIHDIRKVKRVGPWCAVCVCRAAGSRFLFLWASPLFAKGNKVPLKTEDLWALRDSEEAVYNGKRLQVAWEREVALHGKQASLVKAVFRTWLPLYLWPMGFSTLFLTLGCLSSALFMRRLVVWFETQEGSTNYAVALVVLLTACEMGKVRHTCPIA